MKLDPEIRKIMTDARTAAEANMTDLERYEFRLRLAWKSVIELSIFDGTREVHESALYAAMAKAVETIVQEEHNKRADIVKLAAEGAFLPNMTKEQIIDYIVRNARNGRGY